VKNPDYWYKDAQGSRLPYVDALETTFSAEEASRLLLAKSGEGDMLRAAPGKEAHDYADLGFTMETALNALNALLPDSAHADSIWANQKVREAAEYALDREQMAKSLGYGYWEAPYQLPPKATAAFDPNFSLSRKYDPEKAKQLLSEAGYPNGFKTSIIVSPIGVDRDIAIAVQAYLAKVGIQAELSFPDLGKWMTYTSASGSWNNAAIITPCVSTEPTFIAGIQFMDQMWGKSWLRTPEVTQAYQAALAAPTMDPKLAKAVTDEMTKAALAIPINSNGNGTAYRKYVVPNFEVRGIGPERNYMDWWLNK
jgi:ABC-type transport system substrate-binding protein